MIKLYVLTAFLPALNTPLTFISQLGPHHPLLQNPPRGSIPPISPSGTTLHPRRNLHFFPRSPAAVVFAALLHCPSPRFPLSNLAAIMEPSNVNLPLIYHISSSDIQIRFPLSVWIIVIPVYGLDSSFLALCLRAVVYYYLPIWKLISLKAESLTLPPSAQREAGRSVSAW